ncbi:MAG: hypothetical protein DRO05_01655 [Thermoproteota archaeon]|nr:MAG: hypothetical protein DRO05_01655 [Candidatus Korarchaeota archaeon]
MKQMIALVGFSRFPIFYDSSGREILGYKCRDEDFNTYVYSLPRGSCAAISSLSNLRYRSRFVVRDIAINPFLRLKELVPRYIYVYPDLEPELVINYSYSLGISLRGPRRPAFIPLLCLRLLEEDEVRALLTTAKARESSIDIEGIISFLNTLGISVESRMMAGGRFLLRLDDPKVSESYEVLVDKEGRVLEVNFCVEMPHQLHVSELVMLARESGEIYVSSPTV